MTPAAPSLRERRRGDRRRSSRRDDPSDFSATLTDESLFDAIGAGLPETAPEPESARSSSGWRRSSGWGDAPASADSRFLSRQARRIVSEGGSTFERLYRTFVGARAVLGLALVAAQATGMALGARTPLPLVICVVYAVQAITMWVLPRFRPQAASKLSRRQWAATIGFDLLAFSALHALQPEAAFNYVPLLVLPALMAGVLTSRVPAVATAAAGSLMLLAAAWRSVVAGSDATAAITPAGLMGIGLFAITLLAGELAGRLAREEATARGSLALARQQAQLNRLVIEEMADGVLVVDRRSRVRAANPAARRLLAPQGLGRAAPFQLHDEPAWSELHALALRAFEVPNWTDVARDVQLKFADGSARSLRARVRFTRARPVRGGEAAPGTESAEVFCVLFIEDLRSVQARTRQEKLAAMGRVSAGIAHEIRNPLAAIAQANALLAEEVAEGEQKMLTAMVADNVERLKRIVDDVMEVAPRPQTEPRPIDVGVEVGRIVADWARTSRVATGAGSRLSVTLPHEPLSVVFDAEHLRRVLVNLLDNARRYASDAPGAVALVVERRGAGQARLSVSSDGEPIPPDIEPFLFEPFFSTRSRGTGLGLYICRELCERYGGSIEYWQHAAGTARRNEFVVTMRVAPALAPLHDSSRAAP